MSGPAPSCGHLLSTAPHLRLLLVAAALLSGCDRPADAVVHSFGGPTMGSTYEVKFTGGVQPAAVRAAVEAELAAADAAFSRWRPDSELALLNAHASTAAFPVSARFAAVLAQALRIAAATEGAYDPTIGPLTELYRRRQRDLEAALDPEAMAAAARRVSFRNVRLEHGAVVKSAPDVLLDLDGIVAGATADAIAARLDELGVPGFYLEITGEVLCRGEKAPGVPWRIGVVDPDGDLRGDRRPVRTVALRDRSLCTSGSYRNAARVAGGTVHHVFDPRTGRNPAHNVVSASALARSAAVADAVGTALLVLGDERAAALWPALAALGVEGALFLSVGADGGVEVVEIQWPGDS